MSRGKDEKKAAIRALLDRYARLPRFTKSNVADGLPRVHSVQLAALDRVHKADVARADYRALVNYYTRELHSGIDLEKVVDEAEVVLGVVSRLDDTYLLVRNALEFSVTAQELDDALAGSIGDAAKDPDLERHMKEAGQLATRRKQAELLRPFGTGLAPYARSLIARGAFKLATTPLRATAFAPFVVILDHGFDVLRGLKDVEGAFDRLIANNQRAIEGLYAP